MAKWQEEKVQSQMNDAFGEDMTEEQLWAVINLARHCRRFCRSNAALKNFCNRIFPHAEFSEVVKVDEKTGESYKALRLRMKS